MTWPKISKVQNCDPLKKLKASALKRYFYKNF